MRRIWILACVAALLSVACGASGVEEAPPDGEAGDAGTSTTRSATTTTTLPALDVAWETLDVIGPDMVPPGHFRTSDGFVSPFHTVVPETLQYFGSESTFVIFIPEDEEYTPSDDLDTGVTRALVVIDMGLGSVDETLRWFESEPAMATTERSTTMIGGVEGTTIDVSTSELVTVPDSGGQYEPDWIYRTAVMDIEGTTVAVLVEAHQDVFDEFWDDVQPALQSLTWAPEEYVEVEVPEHEPAPGSVEDGLALTVRLEIPDPPPEVPTGSFQAVGTAVEAGWFCAEGTYTQLSYTPSLTTESWEMQLDCGENAGSITLTVEADGQPIPGGWYSDNEWTVSDSSADLAGATGVGGGFSECKDSTCLDQYEGRLLIPSATYFEFTVEAPDQEDFDAVFSASGDAVDSGVFCSEGPVLGGEYSEDEWPIAVWTVGVSCEDPGGEFIVDVVAVVTEEADEFHTMGTWALRGPSGIFTEYSGGGDLSTVCAKALCVDDYFGWLATD
jgi:hypothetical protein